MNINGLYAAIKEAEAKIAQYNALIAKASSTNSNLNNCKTSLNSSLELLSEGLIIDGMPADNGKITEVKSSVDRSISNMQNVISMASAKIKKLEADIVSYRQEIIRMENEIRAEAARKKEAEEKESRNAQTTTKEER